MHARNRGGAECSPIFVATKAELQIIQKLTASNGKEVLSVRQPTATFDGSVAKPDFPSGVILILFPWRYSLHLYSGCRA